MITKIKIDKKTNLPEIIYRISNVEFSKEVKKYSGSELQPPRKEFIDAFRNMDRHLISVLPFLKGLENEITVTELSITYKYDTLMGMVITAQLAIEGLNAPMNINTPFITFSSYELRKENSCVSVCLTEQCEADLKRVFELAESYMNGDTRAVQLKIA